MTPTTSTGSHPVLWLQSQSQHAHRGTGGGEGVQFRWQLHQLAMDAARRHATFCYVTVIPLPNLGVRMYAQLRARTRYTAPELLWLKALRWRSDQWPQRSGPRRLLLSVAHHHPRPAPVRVWLCCVDGASLHQSPVSQPSRSSSRSSSLLTLVLRLSASQSRLLFPVLMWAAGPMGRSRGCPRT